MWPSIIELTVLGSPEVLTFSHARSAAAAVFLTADHLEVPVRRDGEHIYATVGEGAEDVEI